MVASPSADAESTFVTMRPIPTVSLATILIWLLAIPASADVVREDLWVPTEDDLRLYVRAVSDDASPADRGPILLVHGARVGSVASFDVDVPGFSLAADLAAVGHPVYLADVRGYGRSDFPPSMEGERFAAPPAVPTREAVADLKNVLDAIARRHPDEPLTAMGWATGSHWLAATEAAHPGSIDRLIVYNSVYGGEGEWKLTSNFSVEGRPSIFDYPKFGAYRLSDAKSLTGRWTEAKTISEPFIERYVELAMQGDPTAGDRTPPSFRHPSGAIADTLQAVHEGPLRRRCHPRRRSDPALRQRLLVETRRRNDPAGRPDLGRVGDGARDAWRIALRPPRARRCAPAVGWPRSRFRGGRRARCALAGAGPMTAPTAFKDRDPGIVAAGSVQDAALERVDATGRAAGRLGGDSQTEF